MENAEKRKEEKKVATVSILSVLMEISFVVNRNIVFGATSVSWHELFLPHFMTRDDPCVWRLHNQISPCSPAFCSVFAVT